MVVYLVWNTGNTFANIFHFSKWVFHDRSIRLIFECEIQKFREIIDDSFYHWGAPARSSYSFCGRKEVERV